MRASPSSRRHVKVSAYERNLDDYYVESREYVDLVLAAEPPLHGVVWDPACGGGNIPRALAAAQPGLDILASDIVQRGAADLVADFFSLDIQVTTVVSNPPYDVLQAFIDHALKLTSDRVIVVARLSFLEGQERKRWWATVPLARVWVSSKRLSMPPGGTTVKASGGTVAYAFFVFQHGHTGDAAVRWI
jgi:hypothetical protein